jgi:hypothetical protein
VSGADEFSTQSTTALNGSMVLVAGPPPQCCEPGKRLQFVLEQLP